MNEEVKQQIRKGRVRKDEEQLQEASSNSQEISSNPKETPQEKLVKSGREVKLSNGLTVTHH